MASSTLPPPRVRRLPLSSVASTPGVLCRLTVACVLFCAPATIWADDPPQPVAAEGKSTVETKELTGAALVFEGKVRDEQTGKPIVGATVHWGRRTASAEQREEATTDQQGYYQIRVSSVGLDYRLGVHAPGYAPQWSDLDAVPQTKPQLRGFGLLPGHTIRGIVKDDGEIPLAGVAVTAQTPTSGFHSSFSSPTPTTPFPGPSRTTTTDAQGRFRIRNLASGTYTISANSPQFALSREVIVEQHQAVTVRLGADLGPYQLHGKPLPGATIQLSPQFDWSYSSFSTTADTIGDYRFSGLQAGEYSVFLHRNYAATGYFMNTRLPPITITGNMQQDLKKK